MNLTGTLRIIKSLWFQIIEISVKGFKVEIREVIHTDYSAEFSGTLKEFIKFYQDLLDSVPKEFQDKVEMYMDCTYEDREITVSYDRPETEEDREIARKRSEDIQELKEISERSQLKTLLEKYGKEI